MCWSIYASGPAGVPTLSVRYILFLARSIGQLEEPIHASKVDVGRGDGNGAPARTKYVKIHNGVACSPEHPSGNRESPHHVRTGCAIVVALRDYLHCTATHPYMPLPFQVLSRQTDYLCMPAFLCKPGNPARTKHESPRSGPPEHPVV